MIKAIKLALVFLAFTSATQAAEKKHSSSPPKQVEAQETTKADLWLASGAGLVFGFGSGQAIEGRWHDVGWAFTTADSVGLAALLFTFGDCRSCSDQANHTSDAIRTAGAVLFLTSRAIQVGELLIYGLGNGMLAMNSDKKEPSKFTTTLMPSGRGALVAGTIRF